MKKYFYLILAGLFVIIGLPFVVQAQGQSENMEKKNTKNISRFGRLLSVKILPEERKSKPTSIPKQPIAQPTSIPTIEDEKQRLGELSVVVLGDSMVDVLGQELPFLRPALKKYFPNTSFDLYNYGVGASDMKYGYQRLTEDYEYRDKQFPALLSLKPDILIIESFAYNNFGYSQEGLDKQWLLIAKIIDKVREVSPSTKIVLSATIGPNSSVYADGVDGIEWNSHQKLVKTETVKKYLKNIINFAQSEGYPLVDAYHPSIDISGEGRMVYIDQNDYLHPSDNGKKLYCRLLAEKIDQLINQQPSSPR